MTELQVVHTVDDLAGLPDGSVMRARNGALAELGTESFGRVVWQDGWSSLADAIEYMAPFQVLYRPETVTEGQFVKQAVREVLEVWGTAPSGRRTMSPHTAVGIVKLVLRLQGEGGAP